MRALVLGFLLSMTLPGFGQPTTPSLGDCLKGYVHDGKVDYAGLRQSRQKELRDFAAGLAQATPAGLALTHQIAFWLDAYNGLVVHQIVETGREPSSFRQRSKFFRGTRYQVAGRLMTLDEIEHQALRPLAKDPRVHFVLVCGATSCPALRAESFLSGDLEQTLEKATRDFIRDPKNVALDSQRRTLTLNPIFDWYKEDFGSVKDFVAKYLDSDQKAALSDGRWSIRYSSYDWSLNQAP